MATSSPPAGPKLEMNLLEKFGEKAGDVVNRFVGFLSGMIGGSNEGKVKALGLTLSKTPGNPHVIRPGSILAKINGFEPKMQALSDDGLRDLTPGFKARLQAGETLEDLLPEAFAACREAAKRSKAMRHYDVQMVGGIFLHRGCIAEMVTGEGKTLVATLPAYLNALTGEGVHVVTVNDYLARRDCEWMLPIFSALGVSAGFIQSDMESSERQGAYNKDITYGTSSEFGFDYLRDNMKLARRGDPNFSHMPWHQQCQRKLNYAIIDEVDNILIDEARTPLIIAGPAFSDVKKYEQANDIVVKLAELERKGRAERVARGETELPMPTKEGEKPPLGLYYEVREKERTCHLTDLGVREAERLAEVESFYTAGNMEWPHLIDNSLKAHHLYKRDRHYLVMTEGGEEKIVIVDENTGRALFGRQWSDGLHQAVEAKHKRDGVAIKQENQTLATVTLQNYFKLYDKLAGMTGTAMTEAGEFWKIYKLEVISIPTNRVLQRVNSPDLIYRTDAEKWEAVVKDLMEVNQTGRPILVGTTDVAKSEKLAALLKRRGIKFELLNAKPENVARESDIVAQAGRRGAVTIATNMAGRGTDIILGGNPETMAWAQLQSKYASRLDVPESEWKEIVEAIEKKEKTKEVGREIAALGGLHIIGTERHESRRIDNQLRGRAGRQGDPGSSRFYVSLQDDLMRMFAGEWVAGVLTRLGMEEGQAIESKMVSKRIQAAQRKVEEQHFESRKSLLDYDEVMDVQRKRVYGKRQEILNGSPSKLEILTMIRSQTEAAVERYLEPTFGPASFAEFAALRLQGDYDANDFYNSSYDEAARIARDKAIAHVPTMIQETMDENLSLDEDEKDWKWQELARTVNSRYGSKFTDRELRKIGRDDVAATILEQASRHIEEVDLSEGGKYLDKNYGHDSLIDWVRQKFGIHVTTPEVYDKSAGELEELILAKVDETYRQKDVDFPVTVGMASYMGDKNSGGQKYNRAGLLDWARDRFKNAELSEEDLLTMSRSKIQERLVRMSRAAYPQLDQSAIDDKIDETVGTNKLSTLAEAKELSEWMQQTFALQLHPEVLVGLRPADLRQQLWNAYDFAYRPEMRHMERSLVLEQVDNSWKKHLLTMDHLRSGIGLWGFAQVDPKTKYKQEGQTEFKTMWSSLEERITESVFKVQEVEEADHQATLWAAQQSRHTQAQTLTQAAAQAQADAAAAARREQQSGVTASGGGAQAATKKAEPIRNAQQKVGRNEPCPCGSGKKFKNCHGKN